jgi:hypothetical protein
LPPMLNQQLSNLAVIVDGPEAAPTASMREAFSFLSRRADKLLAETRRLLPKPTRRSRRSTAAASSTENGESRAAAHS